MAEKDYKPVSPEMFEFVNMGERLTDVKFDDKPIGYFKDAWIRFRKNKASVVAACIIALIFLFSFTAPLLTKNQNSFMDAYYAKKGPYIYGSGAKGMFTGGVNRDFSEVGMISKIAIGIGAEDWDDHNATLEEGMASEYQPMLNISDPYIMIDAAKKEKTYYHGRINAYAEVGFIYKSIEQAEYTKIREWEQETGLHVLYPLIEDNAYNLDYADANNWYKSKKYQPISVDENGKTKNIAYEPGMVLEDNYKRDAEGNAIYYEYTGGGTLETASYKVRVLYSNYYIYKNGFEPRYYFGTDSQGYDLMLRLAGGLRLSLLLAVSVSIINFIIGAVYGPIEGFYGGLTDLLMERVSDILSGMPFIIVATLFQIHLAVKLGPIPCLVFAYVLNGWIGIAYRVRTQFYRFKKQEFVLAAKTLGARDRRLIWKHIFPNSLGTIVTSTALIIPGVIFNESMLSYLGIVKLGSSTTTSLGTLLADASAIWTNYPHLMILPALFISLLEISFNLFGNGLRDAFNPSLRNVED
ncbi:MAG: ABC transporter permease [Lachnospiraceae bacterium]|nr:ABC transporter permease [Lachnospiraceae bacterium]